MKLVLSVEALSPQLSGIGRYTWELASRLPTYENIESIKFYRNHEWAKDITSLLSAEKQSSRQGWSGLLPKWLRKPRLRRGEIFHGPNYFLPEFVEAGVATIHDLSVFRYPETARPCAESSPLLLR